MIRCGIITSSDKGYAGEREDKSGPAVKAVAEQAGFEVAALEIWPDEKELLKKAMLRFADELSCDLILTTGGTGFSPRDVTPEATAEVVERLTPGFGEAMRSASMKITPRGMLSRATAGIRGRTLIVNLPGSPKAAVECLGAIMEALPHGIEMLQGGGECASRFAQKSETPPAL